PDFARWFSGKTVLVTGATSGIGREIAKQMAHYGSKVLLCGRNIETMNSLLKELNAITLSSPKVFFVDLADTKSLQELITEVNKSYDIGILVNNAGFGYIGDFYTMPENKIRSMQEVNIIATVELCRAFLPKMVKKSGSGILNVGSVASFFATPGSALYGATKYFILGFTDALHQEMLSKGVNVTGVYPGNTESQFLERATNGKVKNFEKAMNPTLVAKSALKGLSENKLRVIPGLNNRIKAFAASFFPKSILLSKIYTNTIKY
ncbi:MAG TPA: short-chain dehydrogenase, partial [Elusimicrobia bacterium]|nr:short-chain dehydrogenase [Elusimicrobiota bacterium]